MALVVWVWFNRALVGPVRFNSILICLVRFSDVMIRWVRFRVRCYGGLGLVKLRYNELDLVLL